ncbi:MAG: alpha/beta fold hydrolase [Sphingobacteriia bacterium]|jgi:predicted alpha/beta hydrolase
MTSHKDIIIRNDNNIELSATLFIPSELKSAVMIGPATGIKRGFYHSFATYLADNGYGVITFDYEGIGASRSGCLKTCKASLVSWGSSDLSVVFSTLKTIFPNVKYHLVGHSAGGQLVGLMRGATELTSIFNVGCSSGCIKNMKYPFKAKAYFFMNVYIPINNLLFGYTNTQWVGMGEPLPKKSAQQWTDWCNGKGYVENYINKNSISHCYNDLSCPSIWINATDDDIANDKNVADMIRVFPKLKAERITIDPAAYGFKEVGHMKYFSNQKSKLWVLAKDWLDKH